MTQPLAIPQRQVTAICRGAAKARNADRKNLGIKSSGRVAAQIGNALPLTSMQGSGSGAKKEKKSIGEK